MKNYFNCNGTIYEFDDYTPSGDDWVKLSTKAGKAAYLAQSVAKLAELIPSKGGQVWARVNKVAASGMSRHISFYVVEDGAIRDISHLVATVTENRYSEDNGVQVSGCGMDMRWHLTDIVMHRCHNTSANSVRINSL